MSLLKKIQNRLHGSREPIAENAAPKARATLPLKTPADQGNVPKAGALDQVKHLIAVGSGKGGVGKSTVALNLAMALAQDGLKVGIMDADIHGPSLQQMTRTQRPVIADMLEPADYEGIKLMSIALFANPGQAQLMRGPMVTQVMRQFLTQVRWGELDYLIIDLPPGTGDIHLSLAQMVPLAGAILVTTPQEVSLIDVRKAVHMFQTVNVPILGIIENMSYFICDGCEKKHYIFQQGGGRRLAAESGLTLLGEIPIDSRVAAAADKGRAFVIDEPSSVVATAYQSLAKQLVGHQTMLQRQGDTALGYFLLEWK